MAAPKPGPDGVYSSAWAADRSGRAGHGSAAAAARRLRPELRSPTTSAASSTEILVAKAELAPDLVVRHRAPARCRDARSRSGSRGRVALRRGAAVPRPRDQVACRDPTPLPRTARRSGGGRPAREEGARPTTRRRARPSTVATAGCARSPPRRSWCGTTTSRGSARSCRRSNRRCPTTSGSISP